MVKKIYDANMEIGNHSNSHKHITNMNYEEITKDIASCNETISNITNSEIKYYRGPYGEYTNISIDAVKNLNMTSIQWDVDTLDYEGKSTNEMCERISKKIRNGSIILMHNDTKYTASGLDQIINHIKSLGFDIVPLQELIIPNNYKINYEGRQIGIK